MSSLHNFINIRNLTLEQQRVYVMYVNQYDLISNQIDSLYEMLYDIRANISDLQPNNVNNINMRNIYNYPNIISHNNNTTTGTNTGTRYINTGARNPTTGVERIVSNFLNTPITNNNILRPTSEQINSASRLVRYDDIENPSSEICSISLQEFNNDDQVRQILYCGHIFHENSLQEWFTRNTVCPLCRYDIRDYIRNNNIQPSQPSQPSQLSNRPPNNINLYNLTEMDVDINSPQFISIVDEITRIMIRQYINTNTNANTNTNTNTNANEDSESDTDIDDIPI